MASLAPAYQDKAAQCRFYEKQFPSPDDLVMCRITRTDQVSAYVQLLEYNNISGMIRFTELSRRCIRSLSRYTRVGKQEVYQVLTVDTQKGYIDLSKRKVTPDDISICEERYNKAKAVHTIMAQVFRQHRVPPERSDSPLPGELTSLEQLYARIAWPLAKVYGHAFDAFKVIVLNPDKILTSDVLRVDGQLPDAKILDTLRQLCIERLKAQPYRVRAAIECSCLTVEGIEAIKEVLRAGEAMSTPELSIKIRLVAPPQYTVNTVCPDKEAGIAHVTQVVAEMAKLMQAKRGSLKLTQAAAVVSDDAEGRKPGAEDDDDDDDDDYDEEDEEEEEDDDDEA